MKKGGRYASASVFPCFPHLFSAPSGYACPLRVLCVESVALAIEFAGDDVEAADDGHRVGQRPALDHLRIRLIDVEAGWAHLHAAREFPSIAHDVVPELTVG